jgi:SpoVK/Ycf46/Vps4 family AAA+-type ATPase
MSNPIEQLIFSHQRAAYEELLIRAAMYFSGKWRDLPITPRFHSLVAGPTGTGKTAIVIRLAEEVGAALVRVSAQSWMPLGAHNRGSRETMKEIAKHISTHEKSLIFVDEIDKLYHDSSWGTYLRGEIFDLLDGRLPAGLKIDDDEDDDSPLTAQCLLKSKLHLQTFIVAAGTFQSFFEAASSSKIGFCDQTNISIPELDAGEIAHRLPRELTNRFHSKLVLLPQLREKDYEQLLKTAADSLPEWLQPAFRKTALRQLPLAVRARKGCRFVEEVLLEALRSAENPKEILCEP